MVLHSLDVTGYVAAARSFTLFPRGRPQRGEQFGQRRTRAAALRRAGATLGPRPVGPQRPGVAVVAEVAHCSPSSTTRRRSAGSRTGNATSIRLNRLRPIQSAEDSQTSGLPSLAKYQTR